MVSRLVVLGIGLGDSAVHAQPVTEPGAPTPPRAARPPVRPAHCILPGALGILRIDGKGRGVAGGLVSRSPPSIGSNSRRPSCARSSGGYVGARIRLLTGALRPYVGAGVPLFVYEDDNDAMRTKVAFGLRGAGGVELGISDHLSLQGDLGIEHFIGIDANTLVDGKHPDATVFVPTLGVIGRSVMLRALAALVVTGSALLAYAAVGNGDIVATPPLTVVTVTSPTGTASGTATLQNTSSTTYNVLVGSDATCDPAVGFTVTGGNPITSFGPSTSKTVQITCPARGSAAMQRCLLHATNTASSAPLADFMGLCLYGDARRLADARASSLDFGTVSVGDFAEQTLTVRNDGTGSR